MSEKLIFPIGFDLDSGAKQVQKDWESTYRKRIGDLIGKKPIDIKLRVSAKGFDKDLKELLRLAQEARQASNELSKVKTAEANARKAVANATKAEAQAISAGLKAKRDEATQNARITKTIHDAKVAQQKWTEVKKNGYAATIGMNKAYATQSSYLQRLITRMAAYMSIYQVISWVKQMREVTAEFELQQVALGALIQDAYKANAIFEQIKVQAVKSPYEVKDLVNYTKRLAAYGVEADDLMDTMNRLADISAGLGADMDRIILAYGQIKAAGVLKGTELRQLTELGISMVDLLAQYYSTLRNEVVSTSEISDMISKKEIPFEAVKDVLTDLTDEGGRFFDMQSKQAETLAGQWSNMKDTVSIMFDEIGRTEEVQSLLYGWIDSVKWLALNWKNVWKALKIVIYTYAGLKTASILSRMLSITTISLATATNNYNVAQRLANATTFKSNALAALHARLMQFSTWATMKAAAATNFATKAWWKLAAAIAASPIGWAMGIVGAFASIALITEDATDAMESFEKRQEEAVKESVANTAMLVSNFKRLAKEVVNSTDGSERQNQALRKLKQQYGEIFPDWKLTVDYLQQISKEASGSADAFNNMTSSIQAFSKEQMRQNLIENYQTQMEEQFSDTFAKLTDARGANFSKAMGVIMDRVLKEDLSDEQLRDIVLANFFKDSGISLPTFYNEVFNPDILLDEDEARKAADNIKTYYPLDELKEVLKKAGTDSQADALLLLINFAESLRNYEGDINRMLESFNNLDPRMAQVNKKMEDLRSTLQDINEETGKDTAEDTAEDVASKIEKARQEKIDEAVRELLEEEGVKNVTNDITLDLVVDKVQTDTKFREKLSDAFISGLNQLRAMAGDYDDLWREDLANMEMYLNEGKQRVTVYGEDQITGFSNLSQSLDESAKKYKELREEKEKYESIGIALSRLDLTNPENQKMLEENEQALANINAQMEMLYNYLSKYGGLGLLDDKGGGSKTDPRIKQLEEELSMVEKIYKKYEEYRKMMGAEEARAMTEKYFEGVEFQWLDMAFSTDDLKKQAQEALSIVKTFWGDTKKAEQNIQFKIGDIDYNETERELEQRMKKLSDDISRTKTAKEFFDRMLGLTGDKELSATLTLSVYGTTGDDLQELMVQQVEEAFRNLPKDISFDSARLFGKNRFDYNILAGWIEKLPENDRKTAQSIVDNWRKANADILSDIQKSYEEFMTYEERRTRVAEKYAAERKKIMESELPDDEKEKYVKAANKRETKELTDIAIEEFKASEDWAKSFEDLGNLATPTIERLMMSLKEFIDLNKEAMSPEQLKTLTKEYQKLYDGLIQRNPFEAISDGVKEYKMSIQGIKLAQEQLNAAIATGDEDLIAFAERGLTDAFDEAQKATNKLKKGVDTVGDKFSQAASDVEFFANALGFSEDSYATQFLNGMANAFKGVSIAIGFADIAMKIFDGTIKDMLPSNPIGWILLAVSAIISAVQAIMNARINRINKEIEALDDKLATLEYAYERLQNAAEKAFGTEYIQNYQRQLDNLEAQVEAYEKQLDLERSKGKKADEEKIKDYQNQIRDTKGAIEDMYGSLSEHFLGQDLTSAARDFASAWIDAYKEFANTTDAMKEKFQEMIQNMLVESLIAKVMERALKPVFDMVDEMQDSDFYSNSFWANLTAKMNTATENGIVGAENVMAMLERIGVNLRDTGTGLTGISRDIATASEESILGLAAGINTQNFYISQVPTKLDTIIGLLRGGSAVVDSGVNVQDLITIQNQFLSSLPTIAQHTADTVTECKAIVAETRRTADTLERVVKPRGTTSTHSMNVTIGS